MSYNYSDYYCHFSGNDSLYEQAFLDEESLLERLNSEGDSVRQEECLDRAISYFLCVKELFVEQQGGDGRPGLTISQQKIHESLELLEQELVDKTVLAYRQQKEKSFGSFFSSCFSKRLTDDLDCNRKGLMERIAEELFNQMDQSEKREALISLFEESLSHIYPEENTLIFSGDLGSLAAYLTDRFQLQDPCIKRMQNFYEEYWIATLVENSFQEPNSLKRLQEDQLWGRRLLYAAQRMDSFLEKLMKEVERQQKDLQIDSLSHFENAFPRTGQTYSLLGKEYEIEQQIAEGTSAKIYKAIEKGSGKRVVFKVLGVLSGDRITDEMIALERIALRGGHPHIVTSFGSPLVQWDPSAKHIRCIVMEYIDGVTVGQWKGARDGVCESIEETYQYLEKIGIQIRDTHSGNQMISNDGRIVIIDVDPKSIN